MGNSLKPEDLKPIADWINEIYNGDICVLNREIHKSIYMLHYVPFGSFTEEEIQQVCYVLDKIGEVLADIRENRKR